MKRTDEPYNRVEVFSFLKEVMSLDPAYAEMLAQFYISFQFIKN